MAMALALAERGLGNVWPNPAVGCVLVKDGRVVGPRLDAARRAAARRERGHRSGRCRRARQHGLCHAGAVRASRAHAALRRR